MHPRLVALLLEQVTFQPKAGVDKHGEITYGAQVGPTKCRFSYPSPDRRSQQLREEDNAPTVTCYMDDPDFDRAVTPVGSLALMPDGAWRPVVDVTHFIDPLRGVGGPLSYWRITIGR